MSSDEFRGDVRILLGDPGQGTRVLYRQALMAAGYHDLREFDSVKGFADLITVARPDLVFMDLAMPEGDAVALVSDLRHGRRSEEHTSELQSLMRISYAVFCLKKKNRKTEKYLHSVN